MYCETVILSDFSQIWEEWIPDALEDPADGIDPPPPGDTASLEVTLDVSTGSMVYKYHGVFLTEHTHPYFQNDYGSEIQFMGEVTNLNDDMPGTQFEPFGFGKMEVRWDSPVWTSTRYDQDDYDTVSYPNEWGLSRVANDSLEIWDKDPNF